MESMELCLKNFAFQTQLIRWVRSGRSEWLRFLDQGGRKLPWYFRPSQLFPLELSVREWCSPLDRLPPQKRLVLGLRRLDHPFVWWRLRRSHANLLSSGIREVRHVTVDGDDFYSRRYRMQSFFLQFLLTCPVFKQRKQQRLSFTISALFSIGSPWNRGQDERLWCPWQHKHDVAAVSTVKAELDVEKTLGFFGWNVAVGFSCLKLLSFSITYREAYFPSNQSARVVSVAFCGSILNKWSPHSSASLGDIFTTSLRNF